ncbi:hypothetical protein MHI24_21770 [Paenibacillus sp. FSL K6-1096]|uniref:hypothetical protein n=1 Tax=Paenibacillus sp. FSL K6-1096 TaxID=2921460 RepID=UPI0030EC02DB
MDQAHYHWSDALSEQDIPAEAVNWENIIADPKNEELDAAPGLLDAEATIGEPPADGEEEE